MGFQVQYEEAAMNFVRLSILLASALMLAAAGTSLAAEDAGEGEYSEQIEAELAERGLRLGEHAGRLRHISISGWDRLDDQHLLLTVGVAKKYLMRLGRPCESLSDGATLQFSTTGSDVTEQDQIRVSVDGFDRGICQIGEIRKLEKVEGEEAQPEE